MAVIAITALSLVAMLICMGEPYVMHILWKIAHLKIVMHNREERFVPWMKNMDMATSLIYSIPISLTAMLRKMAEPCIS